MPRPAPTRETTDSVSGEKQAHQLPSRAPQAGNPSRGRPGSGSPCPACAIRARTTATRRAGEPRRRARRVPALSRGLLRTARSLTGPLLAS